MACTSTRHSSRPRTESSSPAWSHRILSDGGFWQTAITTVPAILGNDRLDFLAANHLGRAMYADLLLGPTMPPNFARYTFLDNSARRFYLNWDLAADTSVANLRTAAGKDPHDKRLHALVGELSTRSEEFRRRWHAHDVRIHGAGVKHFHHHVVGDLELAYEGLGLQCAGAVSDRATSILESDRDTNRPR